MREGWQRHPFFLVKNDLEKRYSEQPAPQRVGGHAQTIKRIKTK